MLKKYFYSLIVLFAFAVNGCDTIEGPYKETPDVEPAGDTIPYVVLFEFTGWNCPFCYLGHEAVQQLEDTYSERIQAIAIHAGSFANPGNEGPDFRCSESDDFLEKFNNPSEFPTGTINSILPGDLSAPANWAVAFAEKYQLANESPEVFVTMNTTQNGEELNVSLTIKFASNLTGSINVCAFVVENGIVAPQNIAGEGIVDEYDHEHVLRKSLINGIVGESLAANPALGTVFEKNYSLSVSGTDWVLENLVVIPYLYNTGTNALLNMNFINPKTK